MMIRHKVRDKEHVLTKCKHIYNKYCNKTRENLALLAPNTDYQSVRAFYLAPILHPSCTQIHEMPISFVH